MKHFRLIFTLLVLLPHLSSYAALNIIITQGVDNPIPVAIVPFSWDGSGVLSEDISEIVTNDLEQVGEFRALGSDNMLGLPA